MCGEKGMQDAVVMSLYLLLRQITLFKLIRFMLMRL